MSKVFLLLLLAAIAAGVLEAKTVVQARETVNGAADLEFDSYSNEEEQLGLKNNNTNHHLARPRIPTNSSEGDLEQLPSNFSAQDIQARITP
uniref:Putative secreted protein n=1 Tax=Rhipicephalus microplus TaxID=6941 RepID=A0A6G5A716_RHIMP